MQALWSRAVQTRLSCRCSSCLKAPGIIARRATTTASKRRIIASDIFTACYSAILATAAVADGKAKDARRKEWDRAIAEAKSERQVDELQMAEVELPDEQCFQRSTQFSNSILDNLKKSPPVATYRPAVSDDTHWADSGEQAAFEPHTNMIMIAEAYLKQQYLQELETGFVPRGAKTPQHFYQNEKMVAKLVTELLRKNKGSEKTLEPFREMRRSLPQFKLAESTARDCHSLNVCLVVLFEQVLSRDSTIDTILGKICYNLLVAESPPDIYTYNILIRYFHRLNRYDLAQSAINSFLFDSRLRPNPSTICLVLDHYSLKQDPVGFMETIYRMRGRQQHFGIRSQRVEELCYPQIEQWAAENSVISRNGWIFQKVSQNSQIFESLIRGCLRLNKIALAARHTRLAFIEGQEVNPSTFGSVVTASLKWLTPPVTQRILQALLSQWEEYDFPISVKMFTSSGARFAIRRLLAISGIDENSGAVSALPAWVSSVALQPMLKQLKLHTLEAAIDRSADLVLSLEHALTIHWPLTPPFGPNVSEKPTAKSCNLLAAPASAIDEAIKILSNESLLEQRRSKRAEASKRQNKFLRASALQARVANQIQYLERSLLSILWEGITSEDREKYGFSIKENFNINSLAKVAFLSPLYIAETSNRTSFRPVQASVVWQPPPPRRRPNMREHEKIADRLCHYLTNEWKLKYLDMRRGCNAYQWVAILLNFALDVSSDQHPFDFQTFEKKVIYKAMIEGGPALSSYEQAEIILHVCRYENATPHTMISPYLMEPLGEIAPSATAG